MKLTANNSYDGVTTFQEDRHILVGTYFFLDNAKVEHRRQVYHIMQIFSEIGGLAGVVFVAIAYLTTEITFCFVVAKIIKILYTDQNG